VESPERRADRNAELLGAGPVEPTRAVVLREDVPLRAGAVSRLEGGHGVLVRLERDLAGSDRLDADGKSRLVAHGVDEVVEVRGRAGRTVDGQRLRSVVEPERLHQPGDPENVVAVEV